MQTGLFPPKANICNVYNNNIWINALILQKTNVKEKNTMRKLCKTLKIKQQCISVSHICCWWIAQVAYCLCKGYQQMPPKIRWILNFRNCTYVMWVKTNGLHGYMVIQPRTIDMILGFSPCFPSARTCYPWNTGPEPVLSTHTLTL